MGGYWDIPFEPHPYLSMNDSDFFTEGNEVNEGASRCGLALIYDSLAGDLRMRCWNILRSLRCLL